MRRKDCKSAFGTPELESFECRRPSLLQSPYVNSFDPYQPPATGDCLHEQIFRADRCPHCGEAVTFWSTVRQLSPFFYHCGTCRKWVRVTAPYLWTSFVVVVGCAIAIVPISALFAAFEPICSLAFCLVGVLMLLVLAETFSYFHIRYFGKFVMRGRNLPR